MKEEDDKEKKMEEEEKRDVEKEAHCGSFAASEAFVSHFGNSVVYIVCSSRQAFPRQASSRQVSSRHASSKLVSSRRPLLEGLLEACFEASLLEGGLFEAGPLKASARQA